MSNSKLASSSIDLDHPLVIELKKELQKQRKDHLSEMTKMFDYHKEEMKTARKVSENRLKQMSARFQKQLKTERKKHQDFIQQLIQQQKAEKEKLAEEMKQVEESSQNEIKKEKEASEIIIEEIKNKSLIKTAWERFNGMTLAKKTAVVVVLSILLALTCYGAYSLITWLASKVITFVEACWAQVSAVIGNAKTYVAEALGLASEGAFLKFVLGSQAKICNTWGCFSAGLLASFVTWQRVKEEH